MSDADDHDYSDPAMVSLDQDDASRHNIYAVQGSGVTDLTELDWPKGVPFEFVDEPGEHDPCYLVMPGGAMLAFNHHAKPGVDVARAKWIVDACNVALDSSQVDAVFESDVWTDDPVPPRQGLYVHRRSRPNEGREIGRLRSALAAETDDGSSLYRLVKWAIDCAARVADTGPLAASTGGGDGR